VHAYNRCYAYMPPPPPKEEITELPSATPTYVEEGKVKIGWKRK